MAKRFLTVFGLALLYLAALSLILALVTILLGGNETTMLIVLLAALFLSVAGFVPFLNWTVTRIFVFPGEGQPVPLETLHAQIQAINTFDAPVMVDQQNGKLVVSWKHANPGTVGPIAVAGLGRSYQLHIKFDEARHTVTMLDRANRALHHAGVDGRFRDGAGNDSVVQGVVMAHEVGNGWGIRRSFEQRPVDGYEFTPAEIKLPILNSILRSGWDVRYGIW